MKTKKKKDGTVYKSTPTKGSAFFVKKEENDMKRYKPKIKDFPDQALIILVEQKQDEKFTKYVKTILLERYLSETVTLEDLSKKLTATKSDFQKEILWEAVKTKLLVEKENDKMIRAIYLMEKMPIDILVQLTQQALNPLIKSQAQKICRQKERALEEDLQLSMMDYEKYAQDEIEEQKQQNHQKTKAKIPQKRQFALSITTKKFMQDFYGIPATEEKLSHEEMEEIIKVKGNIPIKRGRIQSLSLRQVATGEWVLVRDGDKSHSARIIPYMNPFGLSLERMSKEMQIPYQKIK